MEMETITTAPDTSGILVLGELIIEGHDGTNPLYCTGLVPTASSADPTVYLAAGDVPTDDIYNGGHLSIYKGTNKEVSQTISDSVAASDTVELAASVSTTTNDYYIVVGNAGLSHASGVNWDLSPSLGNITFLGLKLINIRVATFPAVAKITNCYWTTAANGAVGPGTLGATGISSIFITYSHLVSTGTNNTIAAYGAQHILLYWSMTSGGYGILCNANADLTAYASHLSHSGNVAVNVSVGGLVYNNGATCTSVGTVTETAASFGWTDFVTA